MIRGGYWGGAWGEAWLLLNQPYQELSLKGQVFVRSYLTRIHSVEVAERIVSVAALNNISVIDAEVVVAAKQTVSTVDAIRRAKKARIDPAPANTTLKRPVEQITATSRAQTVFFVGRAITAAATTSQHKLTASSNAQRVELIKYANG